MSARVGDHDLFCARDALQRLGRRWRTWIKQGHPGRGSHHGPRDAQPQPMRSYAFVDGSDAAQSTWEDYQNSIGEAVTVVDGLGVEHRDVRIVDVQPAFMKGGAMVPWSPIAGMESAGGDHVVAVVWLLLLAED